MTHLAQALDSGATTLIREGDAILGIELGSTRIKAQIIGPDYRPLASGTHEWASRLVDGIWTYSLDEVWTGLQAAYADLVADIERRFGVVPSRYAAIGVSGMMHGYLTFDATGALLTPFRTWRNTNAGRAADELSTLFGCNIPERWSIAHLYQAVLDGESHVDSIDFFTTLAGYVHWRLTGRRVLGLGDASGMFPIDPVTHRWDHELNALFNRIVAPSHPTFRLERLLPEPLVAGADAGSLTDDGALLLDPTGVLTAGAMLCPPEGDAGTGMVATNAVAVRTGNVSVGTSIFAMVVLERPLTQSHRELDIVTTPSGDLVAMVHCNNGASEFAEWAAVFARFAEAVNGTADRDEVFSILLRESLSGQTDGGGVLAYNFIASEPIAGVSDGRPMILRAPDSKLTLANLMRAQVYGMFASLSLGMRVLTSEDVGVDRMYAHGGVFKTTSVAQKLLAAAIKCPVGVSTTASEGGSWGIAVLAAYRLAVSRGERVGLTEYLTEHVFSAEHASFVSPSAVDVTGYADFLERYEAGLVVARADSGAVYLTRQGSR